MNWLIYVGIAAALLSIAVFVYAADLVKELKQAKIDVKLEIKHSTSNFVTYLAFALFLVTFLMVAGNFLFRGGPLDTTLTSLAVTASLGLFAVFALMSNWYFKHIEDLKELIEGISKENVQRQQDIIQAKTEIDIIKQSIDKQSQLNTEIGNQTKEAMDGLKLNREAYNSQRELIQIYMTILADALFNMCQYSPAGILYNEKSNKLHDRVRKFISYIMAHHIGHWRTIQEELDNLVANVLTYDGADNILISTDLEVYTMMKKIGTGSREEVIKYITEHYAEHPTAYWSK